MKRFLVGLILVFALVVSANSPAHAKDTYVRGYVKSNGTYVLPHYRSAPDRYFFNNWSTIGNLNPYTGAYGTKSEPPYLYHLGPVHVNGYMRSSGPYVAPYYRSTPDGNFFNNWSTKGNVNPFTGVPGTRITPAPSRDYDPYPTIDFLKAAEDGSPSELSPGLSSYPSLLDSDEDDSGWLLDDSDDGGFDSDSDSDSDSGE